MLSWGYLYMQVRCMSRILPVHLVCKASFSPLLSPQTLHQHPQNDEPTCHGCGVRRRARYPSHCSTRTMGHRHHCMVWRAVRLDDEVGLVLVDQRQLQLGV